MTIKSNFQLKASLLLLLFLPEILLSQKQPIDTGMFNTWPVVHEPVISNNGKYASYNSIYHAQGRRVRTIRSTESSWSFDIENIEWPPIFSENNRYVVYLDPAKGIVSRKLGGDSSLTIEGGRQPKIFAIGKQDWLAYLTASGELALQCLDNGKVHTYANAGQYIASEDGKYFFVYGDKDNEPVIKLVRTADFKEQVAASGKKAERFVLSSDNTKFAFVDVGKEGKTIWCYNIATGNLKALFSESQLKPEGLMLANGPNFRFTASGKMLLFEMEMINKWVPDENAVSMDVWSYLDPEIQERQLRDVKKRELFLFSVNVDDNRHFQLLHKNERILPNGLGMGNDKYVVVEHIVGARAEIYWNPLSAQTISLVSLETGERTILKEKSTEPIIAVSISPRSRYAVFYDPAVNHYFCLETSTGVTKCITEGINSRWDKDYSNEIRSLRRHAAGITGWLKDESRILINGTFDIWAVDPSVKQAAQNATGGLGNDSGFIFTAPVTSGDTYESKSSILLSVYSTVTKQSGFFSLMLNGRKLPTLKKHVMSGHIYQNHNAEYLRLNQGDIVRSRHAEGYIIKRESATDFPNFYFTKTFENFNPLSDYQPQKKYNWITTELHRVKVGDSSYSDGILYKPENFDPNRKYPVIIYFYESQGRNLYKFPMPFFGSIIDPAHFVSNGYLVFIPDIVYGQHHAGKGTLQTVEAAYHYLCTKPWVNANKVGINGHSFGGYEANYVATNSKLFAAVASGAGVSDLISDYGRLAEGKTNHASIERGYYRQKTSPWNSPMEYVEASPIFSVHKVASPVLIFHNKMDGSVPFTQAVEFFFGLRRARKKVWLLQYDNEDHAISDRKAAIDLEVKFMQFFDAYLKDLPAPQWMTHGVPAKVKAKKLVP